MQLLEFTQMIQGLRPTFQQKLKECPRAVPTAQGIQELKSQLIAGKTFFSSLGQQGSLDFIQNCGLYGLLDKDNLPASPKDWMDLLQSIQTNVVMAERANSVNSNGVVNRQQVNVSVPNVNTVNATNSIIPNSIIPNSETVNVIVEHTQDVISWWQKPLFDAFGVEITPTRLALGYAAFALARKYMSKGEEYEPYN